MGFADLAYRSVFRRTSTFYLAVTVSAFLFERAFDMTASHIWESRNRGKLWKHIKAKYCEEDEAEAEV